MAQGLAGFTQGLTSGLQSGFGMASQIDKDKQAAELFALQKEKLTAENEEIRRKKNFNKQIAEGLAAVEETIAGGVIGGEAQDEFGESVGNVQYASPREAKASGLKFKEGTTIEKAPEKLTQNQIDRLRAQVFHKARIDNQLMDEDAFEKQRQITKTLKKEGFKEAFDYFEETQDSDGAIEIYKKNGKHNKVPPGAFMKKDIDPETGFETIVVYAPDKDGKPVKITSSFDFQLAQMPEELIKYGMGMKKEKYVQGESNKRTGIEQQGAMARTVYQADSAAETARAGQDSKPAKEVKAFQEMMQKDFNSISQFKGGQLNPDKYIAAYTEIREAGRRLIDEGGYTAEAAYAEASDKVLTKYGLKAVPKPKTEKK